MSLYRNTKMTSYMIYSVEMIRYQICSYKLKIQVRQGYSFKFAIGRLYARVRSSDHFFRYFQLENNNHIRLSKEVADKIRQLR